MLHHQDLRHLQFNDLFNFFPAHVRSQIFNDYETRTVKPGTVIFARGEEGPWMGAILAGRLRIAVRTFGGKELMLSMYERGEIFGDRSLLDGMPRGADAIAEEETTFIVLKRDDIMPLLMQHPQAMYAIIKMLCNRMLRYTETMELYTLQDLPTRLASFLLFLARQYGEESDGKIVLKAGLSQADLGHRIASSRESVNRQLKLFVDKGLITINGEEMVILDRAALVKICESDKSDS